jgi:superfamily II DNA or RNA helicase
MSLKDLSFDFVIDTSSTNFIDDFFKPLLKNSNLYYRGVGYFSSSWLEYNAAGLNKFANNGGRIKWITSPILSEDDLVALKIGTEAKKDFLIKKRLEESVVDFEKSLKNETSVALAWMLADGIADIRIAIPINDLKGEFHDKFGYFEDADGNSLSFQGSSNESQNGIINNYESFTIIYSWDESEKIRKNSKYCKKRFQKIWDGKDANLKILDIPHTIKENLIKLRKDSPRPYKKPFHLEKIQNPYPCIPTKYKDIRNYQKEAFENWKLNKYRGIFAMATGTGKTVTSLFCMLKEFEHRKLIDDTSNCQILILVPTKTLVEQWAHETKDFHYKNIIKAYSSNNKWHEQVKKIIQDEKFLNYKRDFVIITTYASFVKNFQIYFVKFSQDVLFIADEVHNAGSPNFLKIIDQIPYIKKIGLSATPKRIYDTNSSDIVELFFNTTYPYTFTYSMQKAIDNNILCRYYYYPIMVPLTEQEFKEYCRLTTEIGSAYFLNSDENKILNDRQKKLLLQRKRIINGAENKKHILINIINEIGVEKLKYCLVYAPGGKDYFDDDQDLEEERIITQFQKSVHEKFPKLTQNRYLGETKDKDSIIEGFRNGIIDVLFAINCLDEGVDIPIMQRGIFTSSTGNPRQFIQRRGRLLRKHPNKEFAYIHDMITVPPKSSETFEIEKKLILNELSRVKYFLELSHNYYEFEHFFEDICDQYQISYDDITVDEEMI